MVSGAEPAGSAPAPWYAAYPEPTRTATAISRDDVLNLLRDEGKVAGKDYVLVDLRRNDHEGGTIRGSINLPAQSLWSTIPTLYEMFKAAGLRRIIWYCRSSSGRGPRGASWFADYIASKEDGGMESLVLTGGVRGWATAGGEFVRWMDGYDAAVWEQNDA